MSGMVYKVISRKHDPEGRVIAVVISEKEAMEYKGEIKPEYISSLDSEEKDMLIEDMVDKMQELLKGV